jgi:hypothetical protein
MKVNAPIVFADRDAYRKFAQSILDHRIFSEHFTYNDRFKALGNQIFRERDRFDEQDWDYLQDNDLVMFEYIDNAVDFLPFTIAPAFYPTPVFDTHYTISLGQLIELDEYLLPMAEERYNKSDQPKQEDE